MSKLPKPGDPDFVPRHPPLDLDVVEKRCAERDEAARSVGRNVSRPFSHEHVEAITSDTEMMRALVGAVKALRMANEELKTMLAEEHERRRSADVRGEDR